jgi:hypothetical protein
MSKDAPVEPKEAAPASGPVQFHYIKTNAHRVVRADGVHGGLTPALDIQMNFFGTRAPIPRLMVHEFSEGRIGDELPDLRVEREGIIRDIEVTVIMDVERAEALHRWLGERIEKSRATHALASGSEKRSE